MCPRRCEGAALRRPGRVCVPALRGRHSQPTQAPHLHRNGRSPPGSFLVRHAQGAVDTVVLCPMHARSPGALPCACAALVLCPVVGAAGGPLHYRVRLNAGAALLLDVAGCPSSRPCRRCCVTAVPWRFWVRGRLAAPCGWVHACRRPYACDGCHVARTVRTGRPQATCWCRCGC